MNTIVTVRMSKEKYDEIKRFIKPEKITLKNDEVIADIDNIQIDIARHSTGWVECDEMTQIYKAFEETVQKLDAFYELLNNDYIKAQMPALDREMLIKDSKSLQNDIKDLAYLFEF